MNKQSTNIALESINNKKVKQMRIGIIGSGNIGERPRVAVRRKGMREKEILAKTGQKRDMK